LLISFREIESKLRVSIEIVDFIGELEFISSCGYKLMVWLTMDSVVDIRVEVIVQLG